MVNSSRAFSPDRSLEMIVRQVVLFLLCLCMPAWVASGAAPVNTTTQPTTAPLSTSALASLRRSAQVGTAADVLAAIRKLAEAGDYDTVRQAAPALLARDSASIKEESAGVTAALPRLRETEEVIAALRLTALDGIAKLVWEPAAVKIARQNHDRLIALQSKLAVEYARQVRLVETLDRRAECLSLWRAADPKAVSPTERVAGPETVRLSKLVEAAIGMPTALAAGFGSGSLTPPPSDPASPKADVLRRGLWFYVSCRRIEAYNKTLDSNMNPAEVVHARTLNAYREALGLLPYEVDARLIQASRRHSKEMIDLWYFSHWSPTEGIHSSFDRMAAAGCRRGSSENIAIGGWTGEDAFWSLFGSPDHHRAWVKSWDTAVGVGKWENAWGECFGAAPRLMLGTAEQREKAVIAGELLKPQTVELTRKQPRDLRDYMFYDIHGNLFVPEIFKIQPKQP